MPIHTMTLFCRKCLHIHTYCVHVNIYVCVHVFQSELHPTLQAVVSASVGATPSGLGTDPWLAIGVPAQLLREHSGQEHPGCSQLGDQGQGKESLLCIEQGQYLLPHRKCIKVNRM